MNQHNDFFEHLNDTFQKIAEEKQKALDEKRQKFLKLTGDNRDWRIRISLSAAEIVIIARVLCRSLDLDSALQHQSKAIFSCKEEKDLVHSILVRLLLTPRRSSSHRKDMITHPDYNEGKWHGNDSDIIYSIKEAFDTSYKFVDADRLKHDYDYEMIGPDAYRKHVKKILKEVK